MGEMEIDLKEYMSIIWNKKWLILGVTLLAIIISAIISFFVLDPTYETSTKILVGRSNVSQNAINYEDIMLSQSLVNTYGEIIKSETVLNEVIANLKLNISTGALKKRIKVNPVAETEIIEIKVNDTDPNLATNIANELAKVSMKNVKEIMKIDNVQVIDQAQIPKSPIKPNKNMNIAIAAILGFMIGIGIVFLREYLDNTRKTPNDVEKYLGLSTIGIIPFIEKEDLE